MSNMRKVGIMGHWKGQECGRPLQTLERGLEHCVDVR